MRRLKPIILSSTMLSLGMLAGAVDAQDAAAPSTSQPTSQAAGSGANASDIVVTGTRIVRNGYQAPTPTLVTTTEALQVTSPQSIVQGLEKLPVFAGSTTPGGSPTGGLGSGAANLVGDFLNLRNFGTIRTLILLDGHRVPPTSFDGNVDVDTLPQLLTQRVDVVTGGASAVYGSDAVTGVVNYVLDHHFNGIKGTIQTGISTYGDDASKRANIAYGTNLFGDRGHFEASFDYTKSDGIPAKEDRPWFHGQFLAGTGSAATATKAANPFQTVDNGRINNASFGGLITGVSTGAPTSLVGMQFDPDGTLSRFNVGTLTGSNGYSSGGDGAYHQDTSLLASLRSYQAFARFDYKLGDQVNFFAQASYDNGRSYHTQATPNRTTTGTSGIRIYQDNAYLDPAIAAQIPAGGYINVSEYGIDLGRPLFQINTKSIFASTGLDGKLGRFHWDLTYGYGRGETEQNQFRNSNNRNFYAAVDAVRDPASGNIVCRVSLTPYADLYPGCVPIDPLGRGNASAAGIAYTTNLTAWDAINTTHDISANFGGDLFDAWAGPVSVSVGGEYRHQTLVQTTTNSPTALPDFSGLRGGFVIPNAGACTGCTPAGINPNTYTLAYVGMLSAGADGTQAVWELNGEMVFPLLKDVRFAKSLEFSGAVRYTHYRTSGGVTSWKLGGQWTPIDDVRFRVVESRDIRAPTLYDLYAATQVSSTGVTDPLTGQSGYPRKYSGGNPNLVPEVSKTFTAGVVLTPRFLPGFSASIDYYKIKIKNAIVQVSVTDQITECTRSGGTSPFCANIQRPIDNLNTTAGNFPTSYFLGSLNAASNSTDGVDLDMSYRRNIGSASTLSLRSLVSYQPHYKIKTFPGAPTYDYAGVGDVGFSKTRWTTTVSFATESGFTATVLNRWKSGVHRLYNPAQVTNDPNIGAYDTVDLTLSQDVKVWKGAVQLFLTVNNLLNRDPRIFANNSPGQVTPTVADDDVIGRYFVTGARFKF
jgi:outer membrane receptor protein involved in Fe transport